MGIYKSQTYREDLRTAAGAVVGIEKLEGKTILITGATGTVGSFIADVLLQYRRDSGENIGICLAGRNPKALRRRFSEGFSEEITFLPYDLSREIAFDVDVDYIIHAAGNAHPAAFNGDPTGTILGSIYGTYRLLEYGRTHGMKRFLYISSGEVYGKGDLSIEAFPEDYAGYIDTMSVRSSYPGGKRAAETLCACYAQQYGVEAVAARLCHTYGPVITGSDNRANAQFIRAGAAHENIVLKSKGSQMRSYCYAADTASAVLSVLLSGESGKAYNCANPESRCTIAELAQCIADCAGTRVIFELPTDAEKKDFTPIPKQVLDSARLEGLGWKGQFTVREGVARTLEIMKEAQQE